MHVCHLVPTFLTQHGPSSGILAQMTVPSFDQERRWSAWSLYAPELGRSAEEAVKRVPASWHQFRMARSYLDVRVLAPLIHRLRDERPDVLHCHLVRANLYGRVAARLAGIPVVISTLRNVEDYFVGTDPTSRTVRLVEKATAGLVSRYVAVSEGVRSAAIKYLGLSPTHVETILNAVDLRAFDSVLSDRITARAEFGFHPHHVVIGTVSVLEGRKNVAQLLSAAQTLRREYPDVRVVVVGSGPEESVLRAASADFGLEDTVRFAGFRRDVPRLLPAFDIFTLTSHAEGLPRAVMEAMAAGLPCVVTDVGGNAEAVLHGTTGLVTPPGEPAPFLDALRSLLHDSGMRLAMGSASRSRAHVQFAPERMARAYDRLYSELLELARNQAGWSDR